MQNVIGHFKQQTDNIEKQMRPLIFDMLFNDDRKFVMENLKAVDEVIIFTEDTPFNLILDDYYMKMEIKKLNLNEILREPTLNLSKKSLVLCVSTLNESAINKRPSLINCERITLIPARYIFLFNFFL